VPERETPREELEALLAMVSLPETEPVEAGLKVTASWRACFEASVNGVAVEEKEKPAPVIERADTLIEDDPVLMMVNT
jgi:hypothetical protein